MGRTAISRDTPQSNATRRTTSGQQALAALPGLLGKRASVGHTEQTRRNRSFPRYPEDGHLTSTLLLQITQKNDIHAGSFICDLIREDRFQTPSAIQRSIWKYCSPLCCPIGPHGL